MKKYVKRPVVVEAVRLTEAMLDDPNHVDRVPGVVYDQVNRVARVKTQAGTMLARIGDWLVVYDPEKVIPMFDETFNGLFESVELRLAGVCPN